MNRGIFRILVLSLLVFWLTVSHLQAQTTQFTYQGRLLFGDLPANGSHDFEFSLWDAESGGNQLGQTVALTEVNVNNGVFSVRIDFGDQFPGANRFLEIRVRQTGKEIFTALTPRQFITSAPYAIKSINSENAANATFANNAVNAFRLGGINSIFYVQTGDPRLSDARNPLPFSPNYIQNTTTQQENGNFNISGNGTVGGTLSSNILNANTQLNIRGKRVLSVLGTDNIFVGSGANGMVVSPTGNVGIGTISPISKLEVQNSEITSSGATGGRFAANNPNNQSARVLLDWFNDGTNDFPRIRYGGNGQGASNGFLIQGPGDNTKLAVLNNGNVGIGTASPASSLHIRTNNGNVLIGNAGCVSGFVAIGFGEDLSGCSSYSLMGNGNDITINRPAGGIIAFRVNGNRNQMTLVSTETDALGSVNIAGNLNVNRTVSIGRVPSTGGIPLCRDNQLIVSTCSSSSIRYKTNVNSFTSGLNLVKRLRPVSFNWKIGNAPDFGLVAEEVAEVESLLTFKNNKGEIEGVKYDRLGVVLINAVQEQQAQMEAQQNQIDEQKETIRRQQAEIDAMKKFVCSQSPAVELCKPNN